MSIVYVGESHLSFAGDMVEGEEKVVAVTQVGRQSYFHLKYISKNHFPFT